jgi:UMF1 family MFS transporter
VSRDPATKKPSATSVDLAPRRQIFAWAMFDFANSGYTTVVLTSIFSAYFVKVIAGADGGNGNATFYWTLAISIANLVVLSAAPVLGAIADYSGMKKRFLGITAFTCVLFTALLATVQPGEIIYGLVVVTIATIMFAAGENFIAAFLPEISPPEHMGRISGYGWSLGYVGGILVLALCLGYITWARGNGQMSHQFVPATMLITAGSFAIAALPTFIWLPERAPRKSLPTGQTYIRVGFGRVIDTFHHSRHYRDLWRALTAMAVYHCGIYTVVVLAAVYASEAMGFSTTDTIRLIMVVNVTAAIGAFFFGRLQDRFGSIRSIQAVLVLWIVALLMVVFIHDRIGFWIAANLIGISMGASQSGGRALIGQFSPVDQSAEFFGFWGLATKLSAIIGPLAYGLITVASNGNHKAALVATTLFFIVGLTILHGVNEERGKQAALD